MANPCGIFRQGGSGRPLQPSLAAAFAMRAPPRYFAGQEQGLGDKKYRAFISYSHADEAWGAWLQQSLERFRAPRGFALRPEADGKSLRLAPVFRDREDLPVAGSLNDAIRQALADSEFQIVLCSPNAARSRWVNEEIKLFTRVHGPGRTFAIIVAGEPHGGEQECFPPALRFKLDALGEPTAEPAEPLAADARDGGDGKRYALLKTAAGMLGVGLDDLVRRDARARARRMRAIIAGTSAIAASMTFAAVFAFQQRDEARTMRGKAETLVKFMLSDLSDRLEPVGKLDILEAVGGEVLAYYAGQNIRTLDADALSRRAQALIKLGQVDEKRGDLDDALKSYEAAFASTAEQLRRAPNDPDRIFDHAQSVFYLGNIAVIRGDYDTGEVRFQEYHDFARKLVALEPDKTRARLENAYATNNLGSLAYNRGQYAASIPYFEQSAEARRGIAAANPGDRKIILAYASALSWLAYAQNAVGDFRHALDTLDLESTIYTELEDESRFVDYQLLERGITAERRKTVASLALGDMKGAKSALRRAAKIGKMLIEREPSNLNTLTNIGITERMASYLSGLEGDKSAELVLALSALANSRRAMARDQGQTYPKMNLGAALVRRISADPKTAKSESEELEQLMKDPLVMSAGDDLDFFASASFALVLRARSIGNDAQAGSIAKSAVSRLVDKANSLTAEARRTLAMLLSEAGDFDAARKLCEDLDAKGVRHPELVALYRNLNADPDTLVSSRP